ncbi:MAG TPA: guanine deaminase, partial [Burkholderiaceae bacterium]|nr:guanine deaminase [Burkholderiaceae bacterium]
MTVHAYRARILRFAENKAPASSAILDEDGLLVIGTNAVGKQVVVAVGSHQNLIAKVKSDYPSVLIQHLPDRIIAPGFVDMHIHYPQTDVIGSPADGLLPWLEKYTFPEENLYSSGEYAAKTATYFVAELLRNGVTTALTFATSHVASVNALFQVAHSKHMRLMTGKCLQDRNCPDGVRDQTEQSLIDTENLIQKWHGVDRLGYAITPRFAPTCSDAQLRGAGELAAKYPDVWVQSHVAENKDELAWVSEIYPESRSYLQVYADFGLLRPKAVYAHGIHLDDADRSVL